MWPWGYPLGFHAWNLNLGGHEAGGILHLEVDLGVGTIHGGGLRQAKVGLQ